MANFNQSPVGQTSSAASIGPALGFTTSSAAVIPTLRVTLYSWAGGMTAGGATINIGGGTIKIYSRPLDGRLVPFRLPD
jgi:hypothetical protein